MQVVSTRWLENQRQKITSEGDLKITFDDLWDDSLPSNATLTDNGSAPHGVTRAIQSNRETIPPKYVSFDQNLWVLDGSGVVLPSLGGEDTGFISDALSDEEGEFTTPPEVGVSFATMGGLKLRDVTLNWDMAFGDFAVTFDLVGYLQGDLIFTEHVAFNTTATCTVTTPSKVCDTLLVRILKWSLPYRRARLDSLTLEHGLTFDKRSIIKFEYFQEVDPLSARLPKGGVRFSIDNTDDKFNPYNPDSTLYSQLIERTPIEVRYGFVLGDKTETISGGEYYLSGWTAPQNGLSAEFEAVDKLGLLRELTYTKGRYFPLGKSLAELARGVLVDACLHYGWAHRWSIDPALEDITTVAPLPLVSHAECLQMIANAGKCSLYCDREGFVTLKRFTPPSTIGYKQSGSFVSGATFSLPLGVSPQTYLIDPLVSYRRPELRIIKPIKMADVSRFYYQVESSQVELYRATVPMVDPGWITLNVTYPPSTDVVATVTGDGSLDPAGTEFYANGCTLVIEATGEFEVVVNGKKLVVTEIVEPVGTPIGEHQPIKNPMITDVSNAVAVGEWVLEFLTNRSIVSFDWRADPRLEANDIITMDTKYGSSHVMMHDVAISYKGVFHGKGEGRDIGALGNSRF